MTRSTGRTVAVLTHGAGSTAEFVRRAFPATGLGVDAVVALDDRTGRVDIVVGLIDRAVTQATSSGDRVVVGGVSLGAHAAAHWLAAHRDDPRVAGAVLALPAWTGAPDDVAAATAAAADEIDEIGSAAVLSRLQADPAHAGDWVVAELRRAWPVYGDDVLVRALRAAGASSAPGEDALAGIVVRTTVVALDRDPLHPATVARRWAAAIPDARIVVRPRHSGPPLVG